MKEIQDLNPMPPLSARKELWNALIKRAYVLLVDRASLGEKAVDTLMDMFGMREREVTTWTGSQHASKRFLRIERPDGSALMERNFRPHSLWEVIVQHVLHVSSLTALPMNQAKEKSQCDKLLESVRLSGMREMEVGVERLPEGPYEVSITMKIRYDKLPEDASDLWLAARGKLLPLEKVRGRPLLF